MLVAFVAPARSAFGLRWPLRLHGAYDPDAARALLVRSFAALPLHR